ncbi:MAG: threonyl-tRNA synthetase editing domain-containing protein [Prolixibacteraceae bacterium]
MKVLVIYTSHFAYVPRIKNIEGIPDVTESESFDECLVAFIQIEQEDEAKDVLSREKKLVNHLKWSLRKNNCNKIILHSFAHLSDSKASLDFTKSIFDQAEIRLKNAGIYTAQTPFGYFLDLDIKAPGFSLARIWATL